MNGLCDFEVVENKLRLLFGRYEKVNVPLKMAFFGGFHASLNGMISFREISINLKAWNNL